MQLNLAAFIFDLDGVITDTAEYHYLSWQRLADEEGIPFSRQDNEQFRGVSRRDCLEILLAGRNYPEKRVQELLVRKNNYYQDLINEISSANIIAGVLELLKELKQYRIKLAVASASKNARFVIKKLGIEEIFDTISDGYSVTKTKPAPDLFLHTAEKLRIKPAACAVVEDAGAGVEAALAAGMIAIGIGPEERVGKAHYRFDLPEEIKLSDIIKVN